MALETYNLALPAVPGATYTYIAGEASVSWCPHPALVPGIRDRLIGAVGRLPKAWLMPPQDGEVFDTAEEGQQRLLGYSLAAGFQTVGGQGSHATRKNVWCIHHGETTRNGRKLSYKVQKDAEGRVISTR
jgi:hypothetical protein